MVHAPGKSSSALALLVLLAAVLLPCQTPAQPQENHVQGVATDVRLQTAAENLASIQRSVEAKRNTLRELREKLKSLEDVTERQEVEQKIERIRNEIAELQQSFEHIALGNINLSVLADQPEQPIDWREEIEQISRPLLSSLKELTAKPRQLDSLRRDIERRGKPAQGNRQGAGIDPVILDPGSPARGSRPDQAVTGHLGAAPGRYGTRPGDIPFQARQPEIGRHCVAGFDRGSA